MKINHYNTYPYGGAANAALRIHNGLLNQNVDSSIYYRIDDRQQPKGEQVYPVSLQSNSEAGLIGRIRRPMEKRRKREIHRLYDQHIGPMKAGEVEVYSMARLPERTALNWQKQKSDIVHCHWLAHMIDYPSFFQSIPSHIPIVWTLHDQGPFTGGCHYSGSCDRFKKGCGSCGQIVGGSERDVSLDSFRAKQRSLRRKKLHVVSPCHWMKSLAESSPIWPDGTQFSVIHYGVDLERFQPVAKSKARAELGLNDEQVTIAFGAEDLTNHRKGFAELLDSLRLLGDDPAIRNMKCIVFGSGTIPDDLKQQFDVQEFGFIKDPTKLVQIYSAADFVVVPSLEDNQPQVGLEAMACGRPVVGFAAGGIPEYVVDGVTGLTVQSRDLPALAGAISWLVQNPKARLSMGERARAKMETEFEMKAQTDAYIRLYQSLTKEIAIGRAS